MTAAAGPRQQAEQKTSGSEGHRSRAGQSGAPGEGAKRDPNSRGLPKPGARRRAEGCERWGWRGYILSRAAN